MDLLNKVVLVRVDFNVPIQLGIVLDDARIRQPLNTIKALQSQGAKVVILSHLGKTTLRNDEQSLKILIPHIENIYGSHVQFIDDCISDDAKAIISNTSANNLILLENLRFHNEEELCNLEFAKKLASLGDVFINEAFSVSHRKHASIYGIPKFIPSVLGENFKREIHIADKFFDGKTGQKMAIIGGAKLHTKINLLKSLVKEVNVLALGGGISGAFLAYYGNSTLKIFDPKGFEDDVNEIISSANQFNCKLLMPIDFAALISSDDGVDCTIISSENDQASVFDIGPRTVELFQEHIAQSSSVFWNGPVGLFEKTPFDYGTKSLAQFLARQTQEKGLLSIVGGGDTGFAMKKFDVKDKLSYVSTAGGAFLSYLERGEFPGLDSVVRNSINL
ncbi:MAG: phosphoglycerate kinase [Alphaproteobacteria bacterium]|nr:phosphoglycerate kinase [Alphaproteobacteria bacterium]